MQNKFFLSALGIVCPLGSSKEEVFANLIEGNTKNIIARENFILGKKIKLGSVVSDLAQIPSEFPSYDIRCNQLLLTAYLQIKTEADAAIKKYGHNRVGVIIGSGTSGIDEGQQAVEHCVKHGQYPQNFDYNFLEMGAPAKFLAEYLGLKSIFYTVSTACSSSAKAFASAANLINLGLCDAVLVGGSDTLCKLTVSGFSSLEAVSEDICNPLSRNRSGITLGEGAALFLMTKEPSDIALLGVGESSDAYHITSPDPEGKGATLAMKNALREANLKPEDVDYINLHGTATELNDQMESLAVHSLFRDKVYCSSTKPLTGHTLGSAGAIEAGLCWLLLSQLNKNQELPPHLWDGEVDPTLAKLKLVEKNHKVDLKRLSVCLSNSFAFGGSNATVILGKHA